MQGAEVTKGYPITPRTVADFFKKNQQIFKKTDQEFFLLLLKYGLAKNVNDDDTDAVKLEKYEANIKELETQLAGYAKRDDARKHNIAAPEIDGKLTANELKDTLFMQYFYTQDKSFLDAAELLEAKLHSSKKGS